MNDPLDIPTLTTQRLVLRPFHLADASAVEHLAGHPDVARFTFVPHPYPAGGAASWIEGHAHEASARRQLTWAVTHGGALIGCVELALNDLHGWGEVGYWLGVPFWGSGLAGEAVAAVVRHAFATLNRARVQATVFVENEASARLLRRLGFQLEGTLRRYSVSRADRVPDARMYAVVPGDVSEFSEPRGA